MNTFLKCSHNRRVVLKILLGTGLYSTVGPLLAGSDPFERQLIRMAKSFSRAAGIQRFGKVYLQMHPGEAEFSHLVHLLKASSLDYRTEEMTGIEQTLDQAIRYDFDQDRIACIEGWWLSRTEARLYALSALLT